MIEKWPYSRCCGNRWQINLGKPDGSWPKLLGLKTILSRALHYIGTRVAAILRQSPCLNSSPDEIQKAFLVAGESCQEAPQGGRGLLRCGLLVIIVLCKFQRASSSFGSLGHYGGFYQNTQMIQKTFGNAAGIQIAYQ